MKKQLSAISLHAKKTSFSPWGDSVPVDAGLWHGGGHENRTLTVAIQLLLWRVRNAGEGLLWPGGVAEGQSGLWNLASGAQSGIRP